MKLQIDGRALNEFSKKVKRNLLGKLNDAVYETKTYASALVMARSKHPTGRLSQSLLVFKQPKGPSEYEFIITSSVDYATYVEYGTSKMLGKHYLEDAMKTLPERIRKRI